MIINKIVFFRKINSILKSLKNKKKKYLKQLKLYKELSGNSFRFNGNQITKRIIIGEDTINTGFDAHYIYHPAWAIRIVKQINPEIHIDISSTLHFCSMLSAFMPTIFYDYRPALLTLSGLKCDKADLTNLFLESNSIESLSCMHTIEHVGLGRYGDPIDPEGDLKAINELQRVVKKGGNLLIVLPVGLPKLEFNAHRIYSFEMIDSLFNDFVLKDFSLITDKKEFIESASPTLVEKQKYGCGCFWYEKI